MANEQFTRAISGHNLKAKSSALVAWDAVLCFLSGLYDLGYGLSFVVLADMWKSIWDAYDKLWPTPGFSIADITTTGWYTGMALLANVAVMIVCFVMGITMIVRHAKCHKDPDAFRETYCGAGPIVLRAIFCPLALIPYIKQKMALHNVAVYGEEANHG